MPRSSWREHIRWSIILGNPSNLALGVGGLLFFFSVQVVRWFDGWVFMHSTIARMRQWNLSNNAPCLCLCPSPVSYLAEFLLLQVTFIPYHSLIPPFVLLQAPFISNPLIPYSTKPNSLSCSLPEAVLSCQFRNLSLNHLHPPPLYLLLFPISCFHVQMTPRI